MFSDQILALIYLFWSLREGLPSDLSGTEAEGVSVRRVRCVAKAPRLGITMAGVV